MMVLASAPGSSPRLPAFGCSRPELGALSLAYVTDLTVAERLRDEAARLRSAETPPAEKQVWENQFVRALACFFSLWKASGRRIVPGALNPANVVVPAEPFREGGAILSLSGWRPFQGLLGFIEGMERSFFDEVEALYPSLRGRLDRSWIFEAVLEALGADGMEVLQSLDAEMPAGTPLGKLLRDFLARLKEGFHPPLNLRAAIAHYEGWESRHPGTLNSARADAVEQVYSLYRLDVYPSLVRYQLYRKTYFRSADPKVLAAFDAVVAALESGAGSRPGTLVELFDLQTALTDEFDRLVFSRLVFPGSQFASPVEVQVVGEGARHLVFQTQIQDRLGVEYLVREPVEPSEIGHFYRMSLRAGVPRALSERHKYVMVLDTAERVVGGLSFLFEDKKVVRLEGIVVASSLRNRGLSQALLTDFCSRMRGLGVEAVTTSFALASVPFPKKFHFDARWGGMVCSLVKDEPGPAGAEEPSALASPRGLSDYALVEGERT
jgi:GNAT superfamily N-acetyltransferase